MSKRFLDKRTYLSAKKVLGKGLLGVGEIFFSSQVDVIGRRNWVFGGETEGIEVLSEFAGDRFGDGSGRFQNHGGAIEKFSFNIILLKKKLFVSSDHNI